MIIFIAVTVMDIFSWHNSLISYLTHRVCPYKHTYISDSKYWVLLLWCSFLSFYSSLDSYSPVCGVCSLFVVGSWGSLGF